MEQEMSSYSINELEEKAMQGDGQAAAELARRYEQGDAQTEQDPGMAQYWREQAAALGWQENSPARGEDAAQAPDASEEPARQGEGFEQWQEDYREGRYDGLLSRQLLEASRKGDPYAAVVLARRYLNSEGQADREQALPVLERARTLLEQRVAGGRDDAACRTLVQVLDLLGRQYAQSNDQKMLEKAQDCFVNERELDENALDGLLWFYRGPAKKMAPYTVASSMLEEARMELEEQVAGRQGIAGRLQFALDCRKEGRSIKAKDWLQLALRADDAARHPELCAVVRYYQQEMEGKNPDLAELKTAALTSPWACLILGNLAKGEEDKIRWYALGAGLTGEEEQRSLCEQKQKVLQERVEEVRRRREEAERQSAEAKAAAERKRQESEANFARWGTEYNRGHYDNTLSIDLQKELEAGNPYAGYLLARRYAKSTAPKDQEQACATLERCRSLLQQRLKAATGDDTAKALLVRVLSELSGFYRKDPKIRPEKAEACLAQASALDPARTGELLEFYQACGPQLQEFKNKPKVLEQRMAKLAEQAARSGGILRRLQYALYCQEHQQKVAAGDWLQMALKAEDAAIHPNLCVIVHYYQDLFAGRTPDRESLEAISKVSSWACLILGGLETDPKARLEYFRRGAAVDRSVEKAQSMADRCAALCKEEEQKLEQARQQAAQAQAQAAREAEAQRRRRERQEQLVAWAAEYRSGEYDRMLGSALQTRIAAGDPYAALALAKRYGSSDSDTDRREAVPLLEKARTLAGQREQDAPREAQALLLEILLLLGRAYTAAGTAQGLTQARDALQAAAKLDPAGRKALLRFYNGPARAMAEYSANPAKLVELRGQLYQAAASGGGMLDRLNYALFCMETGRNVRAQDWIRVALQAEDARNYPQLAEVARYYLAIASGRTPDNREAVEQAAEAGCSWACLALGDQADDEEEKLSYYRKGAAIDPAAEGEASRVEECTAKRDAIFRQRAAVYNENLNRRKAAEAQAARQKELVSQREVQRSWVTLAGMLYGGTMVLLAILCVLTNITGSGVWLSLGRTLSGLWSLACTGGLVAHFLGVRFAPYKDEPNRLFNTLLIALIISVLVPSVVEGIFL